MLHNIGEKIYRCEYQNKPPERERDYLLSFRGNEILLPDGGGLLRLAEREDAASLQYLFSISGAGFYLPGGPLPETEGAHYRNVQLLRGMSPQWMAFAGVTGYHLAQWYRNNRYCGACGQAMRHKADERALVCPACGHICYPSMSAAVIVGIIDGERLLLSKYAGGAYRNYALIAGFVEIGEALEDTVRREVYEEVGLRVRRIRYFDNQPWGFSQSLLVGFFADLDGSPEIHVDKRELSEALWVERGEIPDLPYPVTLTAKMMDAFKRGLPV